MSPMDAALSYLTGRMRTVREVEDKLDDLQYGESDIQATVERLQELNLLNDEEYAREFVRSRLATKPVSRQKLYLDMRAHKLQEDIIQTVPALAFDVRSMQKAFKYFFSGSLPFCRGCRLGPLGRACSWDWLSLRCRPWGNRFP